MEAEAADQPGDAAPIIGSYFTPACSARADENRPHSAIHIQIPVDDAFQSAHALMSTAFQLFNLFIFSAAGLACFSYRPSHANLNPCSLLS